MTRPETAGADYVDRRVDELHAKLLSLKGEIEALLARQDQTVARHSNQIGDLCSLLVKQDRCIRLLNDGLYDLDVRTSTKSRI